MAPGEILHLCHEIGVPVIWPPAMFAARPRYATLIGLKRVTARPPYPAAGFWSCYHRAKKELEGYSPS
jgi:hypothetical protein